jgi:hypothetical protein
LFFGAYSAFYVRVPLSKISDIPTISAGTDGEDVCRLTQNWHNGSLFVRACAVPAALDSWWTIHSYRGSR